MSELKEVLMSNLEHYFENLLFHGRDNNDECNKNSLSKEQREAVEACADYVHYKMTGQLTERQKTTINQALIMYADNGSYFVDYDNEMELRNDIFDIRQWLKIVPTIEEEHETEIL